MNKCPICNTEYTKRRPNSCQKCYFKKRHAKRYVKKATICRSCGIPCQMGYKKYCVNCIDNIKTCDENHRIYFGRKFFLNRLGYWSSVKASEPLAHQWVWMNHFGDIPEGYHIHHKDHDKSNNDIENLEMLSPSDHLKKHWQDPKKRIDASKKIEKSRLKMNEWLKSEEGRQIQREGAKKGWETRKEISVQCKICKIDFKTKQPNAKFCSEKCYARWHRNSKMNYIDRNCPVCHKEFKACKSSKQKLCSRRCSAIWSHTVNRKC